MKRVAELEGIELDLWVARASGAKEVNGAWFMPNGQFVDLVTTQRTFAPSMYWSQSGEIIERERIALDPITRNRNHTAEWQAQVWVPFAVQTGPTPLIAAMRAFVASKFGETVDEVKK